MTKLGWPVALPRFIRRPSDSTMIELPLSKVHSCTCGLISVLVMPGDLRQAGHVDLVVEVADVADDRLVLHPAHVVGGDDVEAAGGGDEDVGRLDDVLERATW